jgi:hypothetical protein
MRIFMTIDTESGTQPPEPSWWLSIDGKTDGPRSHAFVVAMLKSGQLDSSTLACPNGSEQWQPLSQWKEFAGAMPYEPSRPDTSFSDVAVDSGPVNPYASSSVPSYPEAGAGQLPDTAKMICAYAIFVRPFVWFIGNASCVVIPPYTEFDVLMSFVGFVVDSACTVLLVVGGIKLQAYRSSGLSLLRVGIVSWIAFLVLALLLGFSMPIPESPDMGPAANIIELLLIGIYLVELGFQVFALVWLSNNGRRLPLRRT